MQRANYHSHSEYSDGHFLPVTYLANAISKDFQAYGFSDHAHIPGWKESLMTDIDQEAFLTNVEKLKGEYGHRIQVYKGLEVDYIPDVLNVNHSTILDAKLDYTIGAVHYIDYFTDGKPWGFEHSFQEFKRGIEEIFEGDIQAAIGRYYELIREMVSDHCPDIVAHIDRIKKLNKDNYFFDESDDWYQKEVIKTLEVIADSRAIMEVNTKGFYKNETDEPYPGLWILQVAKELKIPVNLGSDSHHPHDIQSGFRYAEELLKKAEIDSVKLLLNGKWQEQQLHSTGSLYSF